MNLQPYYTTALLITAIVSFSLGIFVYFKGRNKPANQIYAFFCISGAIWSYGQMRMMTAADESVALFWARYLHIGVYFIATSYAHFVLILTDSVKKNRNFLYFVYIFSFSLLPILYLTRLLIPRASFKFSHSYFTVPGPLYHPYLIIWLGIVGYSLFELYKAYRLSTYEKRNQIKYVFWATCIAFLGGCGNYFLVYGVELFPYTPFGTYAVPIHNFMIAYAILYHQLFDINIVLRKTLVYSFLIAFITSLYLVTVILLEKLFQGIMKYNSLSVTITASFFIAICFTPVKNKIQVFVDRYFFKGTTEEIAQENIKLHQELLKQDRMKAAATLAASSAHEIKNPLATIKTFIDFLPERYADKSFIDNFMRLVAPQIEKINFTVQQLLDFSKPSTPNLRQVNLYKVLDETLELLSNDFLKRRIKAQTQFSDDNAVVSADPNQLKQVFLNLFLNSIDAMPNGGELIVSGKSLNLHNRTNPQNNPDFVEISIQDTGHGISKDNLKRIFQPFFTTKSNGTGLGLSVVKDILDQHKASIRAESKEGEGTKFIIKLALCI